jgi:hypothetical protein
MLRVGTATKRRGQPIVYHKPLDSLLSLASSFVTGVVVLVDDVFSAYSGV